MFTSNVSQANTVNGMNAVTSNQGFSGFDSDAFMSILLAQLRHQNPLEPMDDQQMISQMSQLNSLEELKKISAGIDTLVKMFRSA